MKRQGVWHQVSSKLPSIGSRVLFYSSETEYIHVGGFLRGGWFDEENHDHMGRSTRVEGVTHWMYLPRRPIIRRRTTPDA